jgi:hypothetical protein
MPNRKDFLKLTGALAFGSLALPRQGNAFYKNLSLLTDINKRII